VSLFGRLFASGPRAPAHLREAVRAWQALPQPDLSAPLAATRFVVVDTETSGLDPRTARVLSIGACTVEGAGLRLDRCFECTIRQAAPTDTANILVHGLGREQQGSGTPSADVLAGFLGFAGKPVFVGFHALFDATVLRGPIRAELGLALRGDWLDLAVLLPALFRTPDRRRWELDRWLQHLALDNFSRHSAVADAWATAQLLLVALARTPSLRIGDARGLFALQRTELSRAVRADAGAPLG
jgi:DNA polymerase-3 subunit epsilon